MQLKPVTNKDGIVPRTAMKQWIDPNFENIDSLHPGNIPQEDLADVTNYHYQRETCKCCNMLVGWPVCTYTAHKKSRIFDFE